MRYPFLSFPNILFIVSILLAGCGNPYTYRGTEYKLKDEHSQYLDEAQRDIAASKAAWDDNGLTKSEQLKAECEAVSKWADNAPIKKKVRVLYWGSGGPDDPNSAKNILLKQRDNVCGLAKAVRGREKKQRIEKEKEERRKRNEALWERDEARRREREAQEAVEEQERLAYKAKLQKTVWNIGSLQCMVIDFAHIGERIEDESGYDVFKPAIASGTFVGVLVKCANKGKKTQHMMSNHFKLVDGSGRQYSIDTKGSTNYTLFLQKDNQHPPQFVEIHPGLAVSIVTVFDVPKSALGDTKLVFTIGKKAKYPLVFE